MSIRFTHGYDLLHKFGSMVGGFVVVASAGEVLERLTHPIERFLEIHGFGWLWVIVVLAYYIGGYIGGIILVNRTILPYWLSTYLHVRLSLFIKVTPAEAEKMGFLFDGSMGGRWYSGNPFRKVDKAYRREALFRFANKVAGEYGWRRPFEMPEDRFAQAEQQQRQEQERTSQQTHSTQSTADPRAAECLNVLGLPAMPKSFAEVKTAYRRKIGEFHPDKFAGERPELLQYAEEMSKKLNGAYAYLEQRFAGAMA